MPKNEGMSDHALKHPCEHAYEHPCEHLACLTPLMGKSGLHFNMQHYGQQRDPIPGHHAAQVPIRRPSKSP